MQRNSKAGFVVRDVSYDSLEDVVAAYRQSPIYEDVRLLYPVNSISAEAFEASLALGKPLQLAIRSLFDPRMLEEEIRGSDFAPGWRLLHNSPLAFHR
jgi:hypothetical protein